ncbi:alpha-xylosidase [Klebsiella pneumoniae]|uniref:Alpha-xylosidase n=1 Tax=Klebsiella pneumoniae TaxID=573 RepID=A0A2X3C5Q0_KLEPN|nr:alpha-xylosidase [Klebsiella pneumoniae]
MGSANFPDPEGMIKRLKAKGLKVCVWINPYIGQRSPVFKELKEKGYLLKRPDGSLWQWDKWQPGWRFMTSPTRKPASGTLTN